MKIDTNSLPNDPEQLKEMLLELQKVVAEKDSELAEKDSELAKKDAQIHELLERYEAKIAKEFGKKSEKMPGEGEVFNEAEELLDEQDNAILASVPKEKAAKQQPKRKPLPEHLARVEHVIELDERDKVCDCCKGPLHKMGETSSEMLEYVPAHIKVIKTIRGKYACRQCEHEGTQSVIKTAPMPVTPIPKSIATASLLAQIISHKYQFGLPLYRQETLFGDIGVELNRKTMSSWIIRCSELLEPLYLTLKQTLLSQGVIHADETPINVLNSDKTKSYMWLYCSGDDKPMGNTNVVVFDYQNSRAGSCAVKFLEGFNGYMHVDGYVAYEQTDATLVTCLAHMRRKFFDAKPNTKKVGKADVAMSLIAKLYGIEQSVNGKTTNEIHEVRQKKAKPVVDKFKRWLKEHEDKIPPKSALGKAIKYSLNQFDKFERYLEDGRLKIDNNRAERAIKPFVIGRKAWLFSNTCNGARASAILYSIIETAKVNNLIVTDYLRTCLQCLAENPSDIEPLLPWNVKL